MGILGGKPGTCAAMRKDGTPCRSSQTVNGTAFCFAHDPGTQDKTLEGRKKGGFNSSDAARFVAEQVKVEKVRIRSSLPDHLADVYKMLYEMVHLVKDGDMSQGTALTISTIAGRLIDYARFDLEIGEAQKAIRQLDRITKNQAEQARAG